MRYESAPLLNDEEVWALQGVSLQICPVEHGEDVDLQGHGPAVVGVTDAPYAAVSHMLDGMQYERGDVFARESIWYQGIGKTDPVKYLDSAQKYFDTSPYVISPPSSEIHGDFSRIIPAKLVAQAEEGRQIQIISPHDYGELLAIAKSLPSYDADASAQEKMPDWRTYVDGVLNRNDPIRYRKPKELEEACMIHRDRKMVKRLGTISLDMLPVVDPQNLPRLGFVVGADHKRGISRLLKEQDIPHTVVARIPLLLSKRRLVSAFGALRPDWDRKRWIKNAERFAQVNNK